MSQTHKDTFAYGRVDDGKNISGSDKLTEKVYRPYYLCL